MGFVAITASDSPELPTVPASDLLGTMTPFFLALHDPLFSRGVAPMVLVNAYIQANRKRSFA